MKTTDFVVTLFEGKSKLNNLTIAAVIGLNAPDAVTLLRNAKGSLQIT